MGITKNVKIKYDYRDFNPEILDKQNIDRLALDQVPENSKVLDIGCATGFMGKYLIQHKGCKVYGVEIRLNESIVAKNNLNRVAVIDIEEKTAVKEILAMTNNIKFDAILATSIIEHLKDTDQFLKLCSQLLKPNGILIVSTPNIAHWSMRLSLLIGNFDYSEYGILDNTHLHFFTIKSFRKLFQKNGYIIKDLLIDPVGGGYPSISRFFSKFFPEIFAYQMLIVAKIAITR